MENKQETLCGTDLIAQERYRQISDEGWTPEHDDKHDYGQLAAAAMCYTQVTLIRMTYKANASAERESETIATHWPWDESWWKPSPDAVRNLVKAGALIAAEIDRLQRLKT